MPDSAKPRNNARQRQFLLFADKMEVLYGGAAGGGKTYASLIAAAQYVGVPGYSALLLRENFADLAMPGAWITLSKEWWLNSKAKWNSSEHRWTFPSGATITFGYLERDDDVYQYDSAAFQFIGIDELTQHTEWRYRFLFGRIRRPMVGPLGQVPLRMRGMTNPGNKGHDWVKKRFIDPKTRLKDTVFVSAKLADNAGNLDVEAYRRDSLSKLDPITRAQREEGDWDAVQGGRFQSTWFRYYRRDKDSPEFLTSQAWRFRLVDRPTFITVDPAASKKRTADYTVVGVFTISPLADLVWLECARFQKEIPDIIPEIARICRRWRPQLVGVEAVASNTAVLQFLQRHTDPVIPATALSPRGLDKLVRATPAMILAESGRVYLPEDNPAFPLDDVVGELVRFTGDDKIDDHDDTVDVLSYAAEVLPRLSAGIVPGQGGRPAVVSTGGPMDRGPMGMPKMGPGVGGSAGPRPWVPGMGQTSGPPPGTMPGPRTGGFGR